MNELIRHLPSPVILTEKFVPHTQAHLIASHVFPSPLPDAVYEKLQRDYEALSDITVHRIIYESDGLCVTGVVVMPNEVNSLLPVIIYNRGGSREYGKLTLYTIMNTLVPLARKGTMVFASNYRGNDGGQGAETFGGDDIHDVLNLLSLARNHPYFDGKNAFMIGHSRGGMMTTLAIKHGAAINAAVSIAGIADARRMLQHKNVNAMLQKSVPGYSENPLPLLEERTSLMWPERIKVPLLLLHGDNDKDVHFSDSVNLDQAIKNAGGVSELVIYPTGSHALVRSWNDVLTRIFAWIERFSK